MNINGKVKKSASTILYFAYLFISLFITNGIYNSMHSEDQIENSTSSNFMLTRVCKNVKSHVSEEKSECYIIYNTNGILINLGLTITIAIILNSKKFNKTGAL
jgi:hypothetical protein